MIIFTYTGEHKNDFTAHGYVESVDDEPVAVRSHHASAASLAHNTSGVTLSLAVIDCHSLRIYKVTLLPLMPFSVKLKVSPRATGAEDMSSAVQTLTIHIRPYLQLGSTRPVPEQRILVVSRRFSFDQ